MPSTLCVVFLAAFSVLLSGPASAQIIDLGPQGPLAPDSSAPPSDDLTEESEVPAPDPSLIERGRPLQTSGIDAETGGPGSEMRLLPLRSAAPRMQGLTPPRLAGEVAVERFILFLPELPDIGEEGELLLAHRTGIDVLAEDSSLEVQINGTALEPVRPDNFDDFAQSRIAVPEGVLNIGRNTVEVTARHVHRIACGPEATFDLWTEIDTVNSGVAVDRAAMLPGPISFLAALSEQAARGQPLEIHRRDPAAPMYEAAPSIGQVAAALGGTPPSIVSAPYWTLEREVPAAARITAFAEGIAPDTPRFAIGGDGAQVLLVERGADYDLISRQLLEAADITPPGTKTALTPGRAVTFADLDAPRLIAEGRYSRIPVRFRLPNDWLLLASQKAQIDLRYRFAADLPEGSVMLAKVNGETVRLLPLDSLGGEDLPDLPIRFQAALLRPGLNLLEFEILVPGDPPTASCPAIEGAIVEISPESRLFVPVSPRMSQPSIRTALDHVGPGDILMTEAAGEQLPPDVVLQIAAALSLWGTDAQDGGAGGVLTVGTLSDLDRITAPLLDDALPALTEALRAGAAATAPAVPETGPSEDAALGPAPDGTGGLMSWVMSLPDRIRASLRRVAFGEDVALRDWLQERTAVAALLQVDPSMENELVLIVGPGGVTDAVARALAAASADPDGPEGQVSLFVPGVGWQSWAAPDRPLRLQEPIRPGNLRNVMGNYATTSPIYFVSIMIGLAICSALLALWVLLLTRDQRS